MQEKKERGEKEVEGNRKGKEVRVRNTRKVNKNIENYVKKRSRGKVLDEKGRRKK